MATTNGVTEAEVRSLIDQQAANRFDGEHLRRELLLEVARLDALGMKYFARAMACEGDINAGLLYCKISECKATLTGMNAPLGHAVQIIHQVVAPRPMTTTEEIGALIDEIQGRGKAAASVKLKLMLPYIRDASI